LTREVPNTITAPTRAVKIVAVATDTCFTPIRIKMAALANPVTVMKAKRRAKLASEI